MALREAGQFVYKEKAQEFCQKLECFFENLLEEYVSEDLKAEDIGYAAISAITTIITFYIARKTRDTRKE